MPAREAHLLAAPSREAVLRDRNVFRVAAMLAIIGAANLSGCGGETTGDKASANGAGATGGVQGTADSTDTGGKMNIGGTTSTGGAAESGGASTGGMNTGGTSTGGTMTTGGRMSTGGTQATCVQLSSPCTLDSDCCTPYHCNTDMFGLQACEPDCASLDEEACKSKGCFPSYGATDWSNDWSTRHYVFAGCRANGLCVDMEMCAYPPGHPENCLLFTDGCTPIDWQQDMSCSPVGCPHRGDAGT